MQPDGCSRTDPDALAHWRPESGKIARFRADPNSSPPHALVVDDDDDYRDAIVETLREAGYEAVGVASAEQALNAIHDGPCLVLMDFRLPRMDGAELVAAMQAELGTRMPPVVFLTGASPAMIENLAAPVLSKPFDIDQLLAVVGNHCVRAPAVRT